MAKQARIPLIKPFVGKEELREVEKVLESGWLAQGPKVKEFEAGVAKFVGARHVVATSSCTTALSLAIEALGLEGSGRFVVPDFTFPATANVVTRAGGSPALADGDRDVFAMRPEAIEGKKSAATMPVHPFGHPFAVDEVYERAGKQGAEVIEDAATAFGTKYKGRMVGSRGRAVCFSFHPRKVLTTGEGGALVTDDDEVYEKAMALRNHGQVYKDGKAAFVMAGLNYRMSDVHAAIGLAQLRKMKGFIAKRREQAKLYGELISESKLDVRLPVEKDYAFHTFQSYVVLLGRSFPSQDDCIRRLKSRFGIEAQLGTYSLSAQESFRSAEKIGDLRTSRLVYERSLTLPMYQTLSEKEQAYVVQSLAACSKR